MTSTSHAAGRAVWVALFALWPIALIVALGLQAPARAQTDSSTATTAVAQAEGYQDSPHARAWDPRTPAAARACESCHGPGAAHVEDPGVAGRVMNFLKTAPRDVSERCMTCHNREEHALWQGSMHDSRNVTCVNCHSTHTPKSESGLLKAASVVETCAQCHQDKAAKLLRSSHMPVAS